MMNSCYLAKKITDSLLLFMIGYAKTSQGHAIFR